MMTLRGAALLLRYLRRAVIEANGTITQLPAAVQQQIDAVSDSITCSQICERLCDCSYQLPLDPVHCVPCELNRQLWRVALHPSHHSSEQQRAHIDKIYQQLTAAGYIRGES